MNKKEIIFNIISIILATLLIILFVANSDAMPNMATIGAATLGLILGMNVVILAEDLYDAQNKDDEDDSEDDN